MNPNPNHVRTGTVAIVCFGLLLPAASQTWTPTSAPTTNWLGIACSADARTVIALADFIYISTNSGSTWRATAPPNMQGAMRGIACSADGTTIAASGWLNGVGMSACVSTNLGSSWVVASAKYTSFTGHLASSADGSTLLLAGGDLQATGDKSPIFTSRDFGVTWISNSTPKTDWRAVACSADGSTMVAVGAGQPILTSKNYGGAWQSNSTPAWGNWSAAACSPDGRSIIAGASASAWIYRTTDGGATWTSNAFPQVPLFALACSADGSRAVGVCYPGGIYTSSDSGVTWVSNGVPSKSWIGVASSTDGAKLLAAAALGDQVFASESVLSPLLNIQPSQTGARLSWCIPSSEFILEENSYASPSNWTQSALSASFNLTNLHLEVSTPTLSEQRFYRLSQR